MAYTLSPGRPVQAEVRRNLDTQLRLAAAALREVRGPADATHVCEARRHVKRARALVGLVWPVTHRGGHAMEQRLRQIARMLGPISDGAAIVETFRALRPALRGLVPPRDLAAMQSNLVEREAWVDHTARIEHVAREAIAGLRRARGRVRRLALDARGWEAVAPGLEAIVRASKRAMREAASTADTEPYHAWRRRVKAHWLALRLVEGGCGRRLAVERRRVEALDGLLGDFHNGAILQDVLVAERIGSRRATAACLRVLRRRDAELRRDAMTLGLDVYQERAPEAVTRIGVHWRAAQAGRHGAAPRRRR